MMTLTSDPGRFDPARSDLEAIARERAGMGSSNPHTGPQGHSS